MSGIIKIRNTVYYLSILLFSLITVFKGNSAHFGWGFGPLIITGLFLYIIPFVLLVDLVISLKSRREIKFSLLLVVLITWIWALYWVSHWYHWFS